MSTHRDYDEILADRILRMGPELGRIHHDLWAQLLWLHAKWRIHQDLFAGDESQTRLMEATAVQTFNQVYVSLTNEIIMHICRITDKAKTASSRMHDMAIAAASSASEARGQVAALVAEAVAGASPRGVSHRLLVEAPRKARPLLKLVSARVGVRHASW
ncbi:MAG: hypothetical protein IPH86_12825 [bacterium]|nr:hypothetical protein [bacterium]